MARTVPILSLLFCALSLQLDAQITIPDPAFAFKLQQIVPNAMTGNVLDQNHPSVSALTVLQISSSSIGDLDGLQYFTGLTSINCNNNQLTSLPALPAGLIQLFCSANQLTNLPTLPNGLVNLSCGGNQLTNVPGLPSGLVTFDCTNNLLTALPVLPIGLQSLLCSVNQLTTLPLLPSALTALNCDQNPITALPTLPSNLSNLSCQSLQLTSLPSLPSSLTVLFCSYNSLNGLPALPSNLLTLSCFYTQLSSLPALPSSLVTLWCGSNDLTSLPSLPASLKYLQCQYNQLGVLPAMPAGLLDLRFHNNMVSAIPALPTGLTKLACQNNQIDCLPVLPQTLTLLDCYGNNLACLPNMPPGIPAYLNAYPNALGFAPTLCSPSDPCFPSEAITGRIFRDANGNGALDVGETPFMNGVAEAQPGNYLAGMDINGMYALPVAPGSYTVQGQPVLYHTITTAPHAITIAANQIDPLNHIGYQIIPGIHDLVVDINAAPARPGFNNNVYLSVQNIGTEPTTATIALNFDADQSFVGSSIAPGSQAGTSVQWTVPLASGSSWSATVTVNTSASVPLGTAILHTLSATPSSPDFTPADNTENLNAVVVGSYDPNDKLASPGSMSPAQVTAGHAIEYTIRFQNTGTYQAERVEITDQLSASLQWNTLEYVSSSHSNFWYLSNGQLHVVFENIDLPHSAANEPNSHGFVKFRITPANSLVVGNTISNTANIFFDFNPPIITDPVVVPIVPEPILLSAKAFLGGCYDPTTGQMRDDLRTAQILPYVEPYSALGHVPSGEQEFPDIGNSVFSVTGSNAIVDWVVVELRASQNNTQVVASRYALVQRDGDIVELDGTSPLGFLLAPSNYFVVVRQRNHLGVMTATPVSLTTTTTVVDFRTIGTATYGTGARKSVSGTYPAHVLWSGDVTFDGLIQYTGTGNDRDVILNAIGGGTPTAIATGYLQADVNLSGQTKYAGSANDRDVILQNIGGVVPTNTRSQQLP